MRYRLRPYQEALVQPNAVDGAEFIPQFLIDEGHMIKDTDETLNVQGEAPPDIKKIRRDAARANMLAGIKVGSRIDIRGEVLEINQLPHLTRGMMTEIKARVGTGENWTSIHLDGDDVTYVVPDRTDDSAFYAATWVIEVNGNLCAMLGARMVCKIGDTVYVLDDPTPRVVRRITFVHAAGAVPEHYEAVVDPAGDRMVSPNGRVPFHMLATTPPAPAVRHPGVGSAPMREYGTAPARIGLDPEATVPDVVDGEFMVYHRNEVFRVGHIVYERDPGLFSPRKWLIRAFWQDPRNPLIWNVDTVDSSDSEMRMPLQIADITHFMTNSASPDPLSTAIAAAVSDTDTATADSWREEMSNALNRAASDITALHDRIDDLTPLSGTASAVTPKLYENLAHTIIKRTMAAVAEAYKIGSLRAATVALSGRVADIEAKLVGSDR